MESEGASFMDAAVVSNPYPATTIVYIKPNHGHCRLRIHFSTATLDFSFLLSWLMLCFAGLLTIGSFFKNWRRLLKYNGILKIDYILG
jgi:hypothetical protein